jgi:hypothetical protein
LYRTQRDSKELQQVLFPDETFAWETSDGSLAVVSNEGTASTKAYGSLHISAVDTRIPDVNRIKRSLHIVKPHRLVLQIDTGNANEASSSSSSSSMQSPCACGGETAEWFLVQGRQYPMTYYVCDGNGHTIHMSVKSHIVVGFSQMTMTGDEAVVLPGNTTGFNSDRLSTSSYRQQCSSGGGGGGTFSSSRFEGSSSSFGSSNGCAALHRDERGLDGAASAVVDSVNLTYFDVKSFKDR